MIKFIITITIVYFLVRSIANKPWLGAKKVHIDPRQQPPANPKQTPNFSNEDDFVDYEEVE